MSTHEITLTKTFEDFNYVSDASVDQIIDSYLTTPTMNSCPSNDVFPLSVNPVIEKMKVFDLLKLRMKMKYTSLFKKGIILCPECNDEILVMLSTLYSKTIFDDCECLNDCFEQHLGCFADTRILYTLNFDNRERKRAFESLRLRFASKNDKVNVYAVLVLADGFERNRLNSLKNRQRPVGFKTRVVSRHEFYPQAFSDYLPKMNVEHTITPLVDEKIRELSSTVQNVVEQMSSTASSIGDQYSENISRIIDLPIILSLIATGVLSIKTREPSWIAAFTMFSGYYVCRHSGAIRDQIDSLISGVLTELQMEDMEPEGIDTSPAFTSLALCIVSYMTMQEVPGKAKLKVFSQTISMLPRMADGLAAAMSSTMDLVSKCIDFLMNGASDVAGLDWLNKTVPIVDNWAEKVRSIAEEAHNGTLEVNSLNRDRLHTLEMEAAEISRKAYAGLEGYRVKSALSSYSMILRKIQGPFAHMSVEKSAFRQEPVGIMIRGAPGVGKTWLINHLIVELLGRTLPKEQLPAFSANYKDFVYNRTPESEYWEKYKGETICVIDDFGQVKDVIGQPTEMMDIIRIVNNHPYNVHMADLESKGNVQFRSRFVIASTNQYSFKPESIVSCEAVLRRFHVTVDAVPKRKYCTEATRDSVDYAERRLDHSHPDLSDHGVARFNEDIYEFVEVLYPDLRKNPQLSVYGATRTFSEFIQMIVSKYALKTEVSDLYLSDVTTRISELVDMRAEIEPQGPRKMRVIAKTQMKCSFQTDFMRRFCDHPSLLSMEKDKWSRPDIIGLDYAQILRAIENFDIQCYENIVHGSMKVANIDIDSLCLFLRQVFDDFEYREAFCENLRSVRFDLDLSVFDKLKVSFKEMVATFVAKAKELTNRYPLLITLSKIVGMISVGFGLYKMISCFNLRKDSEFISEGDYKTKERTGKVATHRHPDPKQFVSESYKVKERTGQIKAQKVRQSGFIAEAGGDQNNFEICRSMVRKSMYSLYFPESEIRAGVIFVISGRIALIPYHYIGIFRSRVESGLYTPDSEVTLRNDYLKTDQSVRISDILDFKQTAALMERDLCVFMLPTYHHQHPNLVKYFVATDLAEKSLDLHCTLTIPDDDFFTRERVNCAVINDMKVTDRSGDEVESWLIKTGYSYRCNTRKGDCGSILSIDDKAVGPGKICGMHVAGNNSGLGLSAALSREIVEDVIAAYDYLDMKQYPVPSEISDMEPQAEIAPADGAFMPYGLLEKPIYSSPVTKIRQSSLFNTFYKPKTSPARLCKFKSNGVLIDPRRNAISRYGGIPRTFVDPIIIESCVDSFFSQLYKVTDLKSRHKPFVFSFDEAILGRPGVAFCDSIPRNTSAGYPHVLNPVPKFPGKTWFFGKDDEYDLTRAPCVELRASCEAIVERAASGLRSAHIFVDTLKDERLVHAKVEIGKTRLVSAAPLELTIVTRQYFLDFSMFLMENRIKCHTAPGLNPFSEEWDMLARYLKSKGDKVVAGDFSGYDSRQLSIVLLQICHSINDWYDDGPRNRQIRLTLFQEVINSIHVSGDTVYQWVSKLPSGHPLTTILNSLQAVILVHMCWVSLHPKGLRGIEEFWDDVYICSFGDDNIMNISDRVPWFNQVSIAKAMLLFNQVYTDEAKTQDSAVFFRTLSEVSFLKRSFRFDNTLLRYVAPLCLDSVLETPNWYHESAERLNTQKTIVQNTLFELSLHSREVFDEWAPQIVEASRQNLSYVPPVVRYAACQEQCLNLESYW